VRLLLFSDLHLETRFAWAPAEIGQARRRALRECLRSITSLAASLRVDALCCGGDLYEQDRFRPDTGHFLRDTFAAINPMPVFIAPGNHDWLSPASLYQQVEWSPNVHVFEDQTLTPFTLTEGFTLWGGAHHSPANTRNFLDGFPVLRNGDVNVALFHGSEQGAFGSEADDGKKPHAPFRAEQIRAAGLSHAMLGHFHRPRDEPDHTYPGNPEPLAFGETGLRGAVLITMDDHGGVTQERHRVAITDVATVEVELTGVTHADQIQDLIDERLATRAGIVRVVLSGEIGPQVDLRLDDLIRPAQIEAWLVTASRVRYGYDLDSLAGEQTVRGQFVRDVRAASDLSDDDRRRVLLTGLRAFDRREDLEVR
jgi:DNA repair exonuclease SbcCD nuclease subunit